MMMPGYLADVDHGIVLPDSLIPSGLFICRLKSTAAVFLCVYSHAQFVERCSGIFYLFLKLDGDPCGVFIYTAEHGVVGKKGELGA